MVAQDAMATVANCLDRKRIVDASEGLEKAQTWSLYKNAKEGAGSAYQKAKTVKEGAGLIMDSVENGIMVSCATDLICGVKVGVLSMRSTQEEDTDAFIIFFEATEMDDTKFVLEFLIAYTDLIWEKIDTEHTILHIAAMHYHQVSENVAGESFGRLLSLYFLGIDILQSVLYHDVTNFDPIDHTYSNEKTPLQVIIGGECEHPKSEDTDLNSSHFNHNKAIVGCARVYEKVSERVRKSGTFTSYRDNVI
ncbi:hypothetical protein Tco_0811345 [Tanacetum coccineum]